MKNHIDDDKIAQVMSMGFTSSQARLALRASSGNINAAIEHILKVKSEN
jgi:uncharacterized UBP type Zn finger protein